VLAGAAARVQRLGVEQRADFPQRVPQLGVRLAAHQHVAGARPVQPDLEA
jgi:hypothetical protein